MSRLLLSLLLAAGALHAATADWPEFLGPQRDNTSPETGLTETLGPAGVPVLWSKEIGAGYSAPSVSGGLLVLHHRRGDEEIVQAFAAETGAEKWRYAYPSHFVDPFGYNNGPRCSPVLHEGRCYTLGAEGVLLCLDSATGALRWQRDLLTDFAVPEAFFGVGSTPLLEDGLLFVMAGGQPNAGMVALEAETGQTVWQNVGEATWNGVPMTGWPGARTVRWNVNDPAYAKQASYCSPVLATIHGHRLLLCCTRQGLVALDPRTGAARFSFWFRARQDSSVNAMTPVVQGDLILLSSAYYHTGSVVLRVHEDAAGVDEVWRSDALEMHWSRPVLSGGFLYAFSGRNEPDGRFRCVELATGALRWDRPEGWPNGGHAKLDGNAAMPNVFGRGSAILAEGKIFALGEAGLLGLFHPNPEKLEELGRWQIPGLRYPAGPAPSFPGAAFFSAAKSDSSASILPGSKSPRPGMILFDAHLDLAMNALEWNRDLRWSLERLRRHELYATDGLPGRTTGTVCFPEMRRGRVAACVATQIARYAPPFGRLPGWHSPEQAWAQTQGQLAWYRAMEEAGELVQLRTGAELQAHLARWSAASEAEAARLPIGYLLSLEGADSLVTLRHLERSRAEGLIALGPVHYGPGVYGHGTDSSGPLTPAGRELLREMERLGVILDVTHLCDESFWDALDHFHGPIWASHSNCRTLAAWNRQFDDRQLRALLERGAVIGMAIDAIMMVHGWRHRRSTPREFDLRLEKIVEHIDHLCQLAGDARHIGLGSDLDGGFGTEQTPLDLDSIADLQTVPNLLRNRGYREEDIQGIAHGNFVRFLTEHL